MLPRERILHALAALQGGRREPDSGSRAGSPVEVTARPPLAEVLQGEWRATDDGDAFVKETRFARDHRHGRVRLGGALESAAGAVAHALGPPDPPHPARLAFLDIETTGLSGGTGTYVFLAGLGSFEGDAFVLRQYVLPDPEGERAMLALLARDLEALDGIVTYNGRTFDVPALRSRATLARLPWRLGEVPHFDLLQSVRGLYRHRLEGCGLADAERALLAVERRNDVPGHLIPGIYFDYLRCGRAAPLRRVLRHNADDVLSMVGILAAVAGLFEAGEQGPEDAAAVARWWERRGDTGRAAALYESALPRLVGLRDWTWAAARYGMLLKRAGRRAEAAGLWRELWARGDRGAALEIAKHLEHRARDPAGAAEITLALLERAPDAERPALEHRLARLRRKMGRG
jgi:uncharacterized protein YprB with RNaseH-like and TPR domain